MDDDFGLWTLAGFVLLMSFMAVGSGLVALTPELQRFVVDQHGWMSGAQFTRAFTIAQIAPGPNFLYVTLIGLEIAGWKGAVTVTVALAIPSLATTLAVMRYARGRGSARLRVALQQGVLPVSVGMMTAAAWVLFQSTGHDLRGVALAALAAAAILKTRLNPLWLVGLGALAGIAGLV
jgi:chromate transporter